jgi:flagellar hook-associated protein 1 FlgK
MSGLLNVGASALTAAYTQMRTAGHNISNVNTPGYSRQEAQLGTATSTFGGGGFIGRGVEVQTIQRRYDQFLTAEVAAGVALSSADAARAGQLSRLDSVFADSETGIGASMDDLTAALADAVNRPFDPSARTVVVSRATTLAERFTSARNRLEELRNQADLRLRESVNTLNGSLKQLAGVNEQIARYAASDQPPNDLFDRRDALVEGINKQMKATAFINPDGSASLFSGSGQALVIGGSVASFSLGADPLDSRKLAVTLNTSGMAIPIDGELLGGGELSGLLRFRDEDLAAAQGRLGQLAAAVSFAYNEQQSLGRDATGAVGAAMFQTGAPTVGGASTNTGNAVFAATVTDGAQLGAGDYELKYDGTNWSATRLSDGQALPLAGFPASVDGLQISLSSGAASAGDRFLLRSASEFTNGFSMVLPSASRLATGMAATPQRGATNAGDTSVAGFRVDSNDPNLTAPVSIQFTSATTFNVTGTGTGNPTGVAYTPGMTLSYNGWEMTLRGTPVASDSFTVAATQNPAADNRNARALVGIADQLAVGGQRPADAYGDLVADIGTRTQSAKSSQALSARTLADSQQSRSEVSGVNLDEEAARLLQYQQAYQAAAKVIATAQSIFDTLLRVAG